MASCLSPSCNDTDKGQGSHHCPLRCHSEAQIGESCGPTQAGSNWLWSGFSALQQHSWRCLSQGACSDRWGVVSTPRWKIGEAGAHPPLFMTSLENMRPLLPFIGSLSSNMSVLSLSGTPTTLVLHGGEPEMDVYLAPKPRNRSEAGYGHALPGPLSFSTSGAGHIPHMSVLCQPGARYNAKPVLSFIG